jgi:hypothetical protein
MLGFPISRARFDQFAGVESLESQCRQVIFSTLFSAYETLQVCFDAQALRLGSGAQFAFQFGMDADAHAWPLPLERDCNPSIRACHRVVLGVVLVHFHRVYALLLKILIFYWREVSPTILNENMRGKGWGGELGRAADGGTFTFPRAYEPYSQRLNRDLPESSSN